MGICRRPRGVIVGSRVENMLAYPKSSSSFTDILFKETGAMQTEEQNLGLSDITELEKVYRT